MFGLFVGFAGFVTSTPSAAAATTPRVVEGEFTTRIASMYDGTSRITHHVVWRDDGHHRAVELDLGGRPAHEPGTLVRVEGEEIEAGKLAVSDLAVIAPNAIPVIDPEVRAPRRIAFVILHFGSPSLSKPDAQNKMFLGSKSTQAFYTENSYGKETLTGAVFGPYQVTMPAGCNVDALADLAGNAMEDEGVNLGEFKQFMYYFSGDSSCGWAGLANVGSPDDPARDSWYNGASGCVVLAQELGHNYGLLHSRSYTCSTDADTDGGADPTRVTYSDDCSANEYGDPFDPMGGGCGHMNVYQKDYMGWIEECNVVTTPVGGTFNLLPTEVPCNGTQSLRIPIEGTNNYYYLEYRRAVGKFGILNGVLLHVGNNNSGGGNPNILDVTPGSRASGDISDAIMVAGDEYVDYLDRVTFRVVEALDTHAVIEVEVPGGTGAPTCEGGAELTPTDGVFGSVECAEGPVAIDSVPPTASITFPENEAYMAPGSSFNITADATDDRQVVEVELFSDGVSIRKDHTPPWEFEAFDIPAGRYGFQVVARDGVNWTPSEIVWLNVTDDAPPDDSTSGDTDTATSGDPSSSTTATDTSSTGTTTGTGTTTSTTGTTGPDASTSEGDEESTGEPMAQGSAGGCACNGAGAGGSLAALSVLTIPALRRRRR